MQDDQLFHSNPRIYTETSPDGQPPDEILRLWHFRPELLIIHFPPSIHPVRNQIRVTHTLNPYLISSAWIPTPQLIPLLHHVLLPLLFLLDLPILFIISVSALCHLVLFSFWSSFAEHFCRFYEALLSFARFPPSLTANPSRHEAVPIRVCNTRSSSLHLVVIPRIKKSCIRRSLIHPKRVSMSQNISQHLTSLFCPLFV